MSDSRPADVVRARSDAQARSRFIDALNRSLSVVHRGIWFALPVGDTGMYAVRTEPAVLDLTDEDGAPIFLRSTVKFGMEDDSRSGHEGGRKVTTLDYAHTVSRSPTLKPGLYSFEWAAGASPYPHVHLHRGNVDARGLGKLHIPTGRVFFEHVLLFLHAEHGVPLIRDDGREILQDVLDRTMRWASWGGGLAPDG